MELRNTKETGVTLSMWNLLSAPSAGISSDLIQEARQSAINTRPPCVLPGNPYYDSLGSLGVGTLLGTVSAFLIYTNTEALLGRSIQAERVQKLTEFLENDPAVRSEGEQHTQNTHTSPQLAYTKSWLDDVAVSRAVHDVKATDMGLSKVRFKAEVDFDGRVVTRSYLEKQDIDQILNVSWFNRDPFSLQNKHVTHYRSNQK